MPTVTLADLRARVYERLENNTAFYPVAHVDKYINDAIRAINLYTGFIQTSGTVTSVANQSKYSTPSGLLIPLKVEFAGRKLDKIGWDAMGNVRPRWMKETTANTGQRVANWIPMGLTRFAIHPADSTGGVTIRVTGVAEPTPLTQTTDTIVFPNAFGSLIDDLAAHVLQMKEGGSIFQQAAVLYVAFLSKAKELKRFQNLRAPQFWVEEQSKK